MVGSPQEIQQPQKLVYKFWAKSCTFEESTETLKGIVIMAYAKFYKHVANFTDSLDFRVFPSIILAGKEAAMVDNNWFLHTPSYDDITIICTPLTVILFPWILIIRLELIATAFVIS